MKEKKTRRSIAKTPSLHKQYNTRIRQEYIDLDYVNQLDDTKKTCKLPNGTFVTELEYMSLFMKEWNNGNVPKQKNAKKGKLHRTIKEIKTCTDRTNARNRDQYSIAKARNLVHKMEDKALNELLEKERCINHNYIEDRLIEVLDAAKIKDFNNSSDDSND